MNPRKKQIVDAAHHLFIEKGFASTSIQDILKEAKISKGTFYNHFTSKNECLIAILEHVQEIADQKRWELLIGKSKEDQDVFAKQLAIRMKMHHEQNLFSILSAVFHSNDEDLKLFIKKQQMQELHGQQKESLIYLGSMQKICSR
ncbi:TetR/AcrR family transcriptional regulator [Bacillus sp. N9]